MRNRMLALALAVAMSGGACRSADQPSQDLSAPAPSERIEGFGVVTYVDLEGGFFGITMEDGRRLDPQQLEEPFRRDGLRVRVVAEPVRGVMTTRMWGVVVKLVDIQRRDG